MQDDKPVILDSGKDSLSVDECRHLVRTRWLVDILGALHEIGMDPNEKARDRTPALKLLVDFAEGASLDSERRLVKGLSPAVARKLARMGVEAQQKPQRESNEADKRKVPTTVEGTRVLPNQTEGERVGGGEGDSPRGDGEG